MLVFEMAVERQIVNGQFITLGKQPANMLVETGHNAQ